MYQLMIPDRHFLVPDLNTFRERLGEMRPQVGEEADWLVSLRNAIDLLATRGKNWRLVYVTCNPLRVPEARTQAWSELARLVVQFEVEVWILHLVKRGDIISQELSQLATLSGGEYLALLSSDKAEDLPGGYQTEQRLTVAMHRSLDLSLTHTGEP